jgi:DNA-binding NtrC family response regulator
LEALKLDVENKTFSDDALNVLMNHDWPGNIRELENMVRYLLVATNEKIINVHNLPRNIIDSGRRNILNDTSSLFVKETDDLEMTPSRPLSEQFMDMSWEDVERIYAHYILKKNGWNVTRASKAAGVNRSTFASRLRKLGIKRE